MNTEALVQLLLDLARVAATAASEETLLLELAVLARSVIPVDGTAIMTVDGEKHRFLQSGIAGAVLTDALHETLLAGPGAAAARTGRLVVIDDLTAEQSWPGYVALASTVDVCSVVAVPVMADGKVRAVLELHRCPPGAWAAADVGAAAVMAHAVGSHLSVATGRASLTTTEQQLPRQTPRSPDSKQGQSPTGPDPVGTPVILIIPLPAHASSAGRARGCCGRCWRAGWTPTPKTSLCCSPLSW